MSPMMFVKLKKTVMELLKMFKSKTIYYLEYSTFYFGSVSVAKSNFGGKWVNQSMKIRFLTLNDCEQDEPHSKKS